MPTGHVFVVQGRLESVDADVVVVPTDWNFTVEPAWSKVWPDPHRPPSRPAGWGQGSVGRITDDSPGCPHLWFIDVADDLTQTPDDTIAKIVDGVSVVIKESRLAPRNNNRVNPLVAIPTLGVRGGGLGSMRGRLIEQLLAVASSAAAQHEVDVVIVAYNPSDHAAFQHLRRKRPNPLAADLEKRARSIAEKAKSGELALFVGAGVSMSAGLPSWSALLDKLQVGDNKLDKSSGLNDLDLAELLDSENPDFRSRVVEAIGRPHRAGLSHLLLADLGCEEVVTTNFDLLYELATDAGRHRSVATLPWQNLESRDPWVLKMHGDIDHPDSIVLTRRDFIRYGSAHGPAGAVFQALLLSRHLLIVGASLTDDNFLRLAYEVDQFAKKRESARPLGTVLTHEPQPYRERLFKGIFTYVDASRGAIESDYGRALAIFLDAVAMYATRDSTFLLDPAYGALLTDTGRQLAADLRPLIGRIKAESARSVEP